MSKTIRNWVDSKGSPPETVLALDKIEAKRVLKLHTDAALDRWLIILEEAGISLAEPGRRKRWVGKVGTPNRRRMYVFRAASEYDLSRQVNRLIYDMRESGDPRAGASIGFTRP